MVSVAPPPLGPGPCPSLDALLAVRPGDLSDDELGDHLVALHTAEARVNAAKVKATGVFDTRAVWAADGARSLEGWVAARTGASYGTAKGDKEISRHLRPMTATEAAFDLGTLSRDQVRVLAKTRVPDLADAFDACETLLVEQVAGMTVAAAVRFLRRWAAEVRERFGIGEPDGPEPADTGTGDKVHLSCTFDGRWRLDGDLTGETGEIIRNVVDAQVDAMWNDGVFHTDDGLAASERFATALAEVVVRGSKGGDDDGTARPLLVGLVHVNADGCGCSCRQGGSTDHSADEPGDRPHWVDPDRPASRDEEATTTRPTYGAFDAVPIWDGLLPDADDDGSATDRPVPDDGAAFTSTPAGVASGRPPADLFGLAELEHAGLVHPSQTHRWLCEGTLQLLHVDEGHDDLRLGRKVRLATRAQRRALRGRDGGCVFPGCHVSASYCIAHHVRWWEWDGDTDIENLALLCRFHHKAVHDRGFQLTRDSGRVRVTRPDGTPLVATRRTRPDPGLRPIVPRARAPVEPDTDEILLTRLIRHRVDALIAHARQARAGP